MLHGVRFRRTDNGVAVRVYKDDPDFRKGVTLLVVFDFGQPGQVQAFRQMMADLVQDTYVWPDPLPQGRNRYAVEVQGAANGVLCRKSGEPSQVFELPEDQPGLLAWFNALT